MASGWRHLTGQKNSKEADAPAVRRSRRVLLRHYWRQARGSRWLLAVIVASMVIDGVLQAGLIGYLKVMIDGLLADPSGFVQNGLLRMMLLGATAAILFFPVAYGGHVACSILASRLVTSFRMDLYRHLQCLSIGFFHVHRTGDIIARLTQDVDGGVGFLVGFVTDGSWAAGMLLTATVSMFVLNWKLTLIFIALNTLYYAIWRMFRRRVERNARRVREHAGEVAAYATEDVAAVAVMKAFAREEYFYDRFNRAQDQLYQANVDSAKAHHAFSDILQVLGKFVAPVVILGAGAFWVDRGELSIGTLVAFWSYWGLVQGPLSILYGAGPGLANSMASMNRILNFYDEIPTPADRPGALHFRPCGGEVRFDEVRFSYPGAPHRPVFEGLSITIPAHTSLGIVGHSGAGKSTLVQLALRFYDPQAGSIRIDGTDLRDMTQASLRNATGVVMQESMLLSGTIRDNVLLGDEKARDAAVWAALEQAGAADFVRESAGGLNEIVGERGVTLSGGQRQRICIARVFLKNPPLLIFDEATSALDTATETLIQEAMQRLLKGRTSIIIAHRLSTLAACDNILMLEKGRVLGMAPHAILLATCPAYAELVAKQNLAGEEQGQPRAEGAVCPGPFAAGAAQA